MKLLALIICFSIVILPVSALEIQAPAVPEAGEEWMPERTDSLWGGMESMVKKALLIIRPDLREAAEVSLGIFAAVLLVSLLQSFSSPSKNGAEIVGTIAIAAILLGNTNSMVNLASDTVREIGEYGKLLLPVMTAALAAQGGVGTSASLYAGSAMFIGLLQSALPAFFLPGIYLYLSLSAGSSATGEGMLKKTADLLKGFLSWSLKILLMVFTTYLGLTGVVSGTTDAAVLKAAKVTMSSFIPVVGGILSDASEAVLVSAAQMKNAAGLYGMFAAIALCIHPFLQIGVHYLVLKLTSGISSVFGSSRMVSMIDAFCTALGMLLGMTAASCIMVLISTVCFMRGVG